MVSTYMSDDGIANFFKDGDMYPDWPADLDNAPSELSWWMNAVDSVKAFGNEQFKASSILKFFTSHLEFIFSFIILTENPLLKGFQ